MPRCVPFQGACLTAKCPPMLRRASSGFCRSLVPCHVVFQFPPASSGFCRGLVPCYVVYQSRSFFYFHAPYAGARPSATLSLHPKLYAERLHFYSVSNSFFPPLLLPHSPSSSNHLIPTSDRTSVAARNPIVMMMSNRKTLALTLLLLLCALAPYATAIKGMPGVNCSYCSKCVALFTTCKTPLATTCGMCPALLSYVQQSVRCHYPACYFCKHGDESSLFTCNATNIADLCSRAVEYWREFPVPSPDAVPRGSRISRGLRHWGKECTWRDADDRVVIPLAACHSLPLGWSRVSRDV